jgi:hypothetical protein
MTPVDGRIYIGELEQELQRAAHTIRQWVAQGALPAELRPSREGGRQRMYWTVDQLPGLREFAREREQRRGWQAQHQGSRT